MNFKKDLVYKLPFFSALAALIIAIPLRVYQYFKILEPETGFYNTVDFSVYAMYILLGAAMIISIVVPIINKKKLTTVNSVKKSPVFLVVSLIFAVTLIVDSATQLISYFDLYESAAMLTSSVTEYVKDQGGTLLLLQSISGAVAAIFFFTSGLMATLGNTDCSRLKILALTPVLWTIFKLLYRFKRTISFVNVSDLMLELFAICFMMLFFFAYAQVISKIDAETVFNKLYSYGVPAVIFTLVCFLPRFIVTITGNSNLLSEHHGISYSDLGAAVYIVYVLLSRTKAQINED